MDYSYRDKGPSWSKDPPRSKKSSTDYSYNGQFIEEDEEPTQENKRVIDLKDPLDSISLNSTENLAVIAGLRGVLQVIKIVVDEENVDEGPFIINDVDLKRTKKRNLVYSAKNVKWNKNNDDLIAATSSAGPITVWNVSDGSHQAIKAHERSVTCIDWNYEDPNVLISGSKDCHVFMFDLRTPEKKIGDFIDGTSEAIHDLAFVNHPGAFNYFFTGDDSGALKLWDRRITGRFVFQRTAHNSFVSTLSVNPSNKYLLATGGGRDKVVKVWDWSRGKIDGKCVVETTAPLGKCIWRPNKPFQIATCASVNDQCVHIWDIRRPFIPLATYEEHTDSVTDACWPLSSLPEMDLFLSCGKDNIVVLHTSESGHAPISYACDIPFDITPDGVIAIACNTEIHQKNQEMEKLPKAAKTSNPAVDQLNRQRKKQPVKKYEPFSGPIKSIVTCGLPDTMRISLPPNEFYHLAQKYLLGGRKLSRICTLNAKIAKELGKEHVAQTWRLVEALISQAKLQEIYDEDERKLKIDTARRWDIRKKELAREGNRVLPNVNELNIDNMKRIFADKLESTLLVNEFINESNEQSEDSAPDSWENSEEDKAESEEEHEKHLYSEQESEGTSEKGKNRAKKRRRNRNLSIAEFYFGGAESNYYHEQERKENLQLNEFMGLRDEAFELRTIFKDQKFFCDASKSAENGNDSGWSPMMEVMRLLRYHSEQGDVQTCASVAIVCGSKLFEAVDTYTVEAWIDSYMEMLNRLELFVTIAKIKKYCAIYRINSMSQQGTAVEIVHSECEKPVINGRCQKCEKVAAPICSMCRQPVTGLVYECRICRHIMHPEHAQIWFVENNLCCAIDCLCNCRDSEYPKLVRYYVEGDDVEIDAEPLPESTSKITQKLIDRGIVAPKGYDIEEYENDSEEEFDDSDDSEREDYHELGGVETKYLRISATKTEYSENNKILQLTLKQKEMVDEFEKVPLKKWTEGHFYGILEQMAKQKDDRRKGGNKKDEGKIDDWEHEEEVEDLLASDVSGTISESEFDYFEHVQIPESKPISGDEKEEEKVEDNVDLVETVQKESEEVDRLEKEKRDAEAEAEQIRMKEVEEEEARENEEFSQPRSRESDISEVNETKSVSSSITSIRTPSPTMTASTFAYKHIFGSDISSDDLDDEEEYEIEEYEDEEYDEEEIEETELEKEERLRLLEISGKMVNLVVEGNKRVAMRAPHEIGVGCFEDFEGGSDNFENEEELEMAEGEGNLRECGCEIRIPIENEAKFVERWNNAMIIAEEQISSLQRELEEAIKQLEELRTPEDVLETDSEKAEEGIDENGEDQTWKNPPMEEEYSWKMPEFITILKRTNTMIDQQYNQAFIDQVQNDKFLICRKGEIASDCVQNQWRILESLENVQEAARIEARMFGEFVMVFYFVPWKRIRNNELLVRKMFEMWEEYKNARKNTCREHFYDFLFKFFSSSIAAKIKFDYVNIIKSGEKDVEISEEEEDYEDDEEENEENEEESDEEEFGIDNIDWTNLKSCLKSFDNLEEQELEDKIIGPIAENRIERYTNEEKEYVKKYWNIFGKSEIEIKSREKKESNKKFRKPRRIVKELFGIKIERKYESKIRKYNEKYPERVRDFIRKNDGGNWKKNDIYQTRSELYYQPKDTCFPICEFEDSNHIITIYPKTPKFLQALKLRLRHKFTGKYHDQLKIDSNHYQILKSSKFQRFQKIIKSKEIGKKPAKLGRIIEETDESLFWYNFFDKIRGCYTQIEDEIMKIERESEKLIEEEERKKYQKRLRGENRKYEIANIWKMKWFLRFEQNCRDALKIMDRAKYLVDRDIRLWLQYNFQIHEKRRNLAIQRRTERRLRRRANKYGIDRDPQIIDPKLIDFLPIEQRDIIETEEELEYDEEQNWQCHAYQQGCLSIIDIERQYDFDNEKHFYEARTKPEIERVDTNTTTSFGTCPTSPSDDGSLELAEQSEYIIENLEKIDYENEQKVIKMKLGGRNYRSNLEKKDERIELYENMKESLEKNDEKVEEKTENVFDFIRKLHEREMERVSNREIRRIHENRFAMMNYSNEYERIGECFGELDKLEHRSNVRGKFRMKYCGDKLGSSYYLNSFFAWILRTFSSGMIIDRSSIKHVIDLFWENGARNEVDEFYEMMRAQITQSTEYSMGFTCEEVEELGQDVIDLFQDELIEIQVIDVVNDMLSEVEHYEIQQREQMSAVSTPSRWLKTYFKRSIYKMNMTEFFQWKWVDYYKELACFYQRIEEFRRRSEEEVLNDQRKGEMLKSILKKQGYKIMLENGDLETAELLEMEKYWVPAPPVLQEMNHVEEIELMIKFLDLNMDEIKPHFGQLLLDFLIEYPKCAEIMEKAECSNGFYEKEEFDELKNQLIQYQKSADNNFRNDPESEYSVVPKYAIGNNWDTYSDIMKKFGKNTIDKKYIKLEFQPFSRSLSNSEFSSSASSSALSETTYNSVQNLNEYELYFSHQNFSYRQPLLILIFEPQDFVEKRRNFEKIIENFSSIDEFYRLLQIERIIQSSKEKFGEEISKKYGKVLFDCRISVIIDTKLNPWFYLIQSKNEKMEKNFEKCGNIDESTRFEMLRQSKIFTENIIKIHRIDQILLKFCPILHIQNDYLLKIANIRTEMEIEKLTKQEAFEMLDVICKMREPSSEKVKLLERIFKHWYPEWRYERTKNLVSDEEHAEQIIQNQVKMAMNYAYQYYRMIKYDPVLSKTKCKDFSIRFPTFRQDVPSSSLLSNLRECIVDFLQNVSINLPDRNSINKQILEIAEHGNPNPRIMFSRAKSGGNSLGRGGVNEDLNVSMDDLRSTKNANLNNNSSQNTMNDCYDEILWLRSKYEMKDMVRRRFTAQISYEIVKMTLMKVAPKLANFKLAERKFEELMKKHARQRPLLDMMLTKISGIDEMTDEQRQFLYENKLINEEDIHGFKHDHLEESSTRKTSFLTTRSEESIKISFLPSGKLPEPFSSDDEEEEPEEHHKSEIKIEMINEKLRKISEISEDYSIDDFDDGNHIYSSEKKIIGKSLWERREKLKAEYHDIAMKDRNVVLAKLPKQLKYVIDRITQIIRDNCDVAHPSWGQLRQIDKWDDILGPDGPSEEEIRKYDGNVPKKMYIAPKVYDSSNPGQNGSRWF